jgi:hypothetical protein
LLNVLPRARLIFYHSRRGVALHLTHNSGNDYMALPKKIYRKVEKVKKEGKKWPGALNCQQRMAKTAQVLSNLNENLFDFFDFAVYKILHVSNCYNRVRNVG